MRGALAAGWLVLALAIAPDARANEPGLFCLDRAELAAQRKHASSLAKKYIYSETSSFGPMISGYERWLAAAERGDADAQRKIGGFWAACILDGDGMSAHKQATAAGYLGAAAKRGDTQAMRYLALFHALGAGVPADYAESYRQLIASGYPAEAAAKQATALKYARASPAEQQAMLVFTEALSALLKERLQAMSEQVVREDAAGRTLSVRAAFHTCPNRAEVLQADEGIQRDALISQLQTLAQRLPSTGLPCVIDDGRPMGVLVPFSIRRP